MIDPGTAADAPDGEEPPALRTACAQVAPDASSAEALASVAKPLRYDSSAMICAISGYPRSGCGEQVSGDGGKKDGSGEPSAPAASSAPAADDGDGVDDGDGGGGPSAGLLVGIGAVLLLGVAAVFQARRRR